MAALVAFGDCLSGSFHFDDYAMLANPQGPSWWLQTRPLTQFTFWLNYLAGGAHPFGYHLVNLLLHIAVVCLLYQVLRGICPENVAFVAAAVFAIHPIQSEAIAYVFARSSLLATFFCLLTWRAWRRDRSTLALVYFTAALLSKEECVTFPFVLAVFGPRRWKPLAGMLGIALAAGLHTIYDTHAVAGSGAGFTAGVSPIVYLGSQGIAILRYFRLLAIPWGFTVDPDIPTNMWAEVAAWIVVTAAIWRLRKWPWFIAGMLLLIPSSSIFPAADFAADRRMYLPMCAFCVAAALLVRRVKSSYLAPIALILVGLSIGRMAVWRSERTLWAEAVERSPGKARPAIQLARAVPPQEALQVLSQAPVTADVLTERGRVFLDLQQPAEALGEFGRALALAPRDVHAINNRGVALLALGQAKAAEADFQRALSIDPNFLDARQNLARATAAGK